MFDNMTKKLTEKMGRTVKEAAQPLQTAVTQAANDKMDLYSKILKFGMLVLLFIGGTRQLTNESNKESGPSQITINNYLCDKPERKVNS